MMPELLGRTREQEGQFEKVNESESCLRRERIRNQ